MAKVIKNITIGWSWSGDTYSLKGFNIMITPSNVTPTSAGQNAVAMATVPKSATSYIFANIVLDNGTTYTSWIQALYDGKDGDWINNNNVTVTDDGNATIENVNASQTKANTAESNAKGYADTYSLIDGMAIGGVYTGSFEINKQIDGVDNIGEVKLNAGKFIHPNGLEYDITANAINTTIEGLSSQDWRYIAFIGSDFSRFTGGIIGSQQFIGIKFVNGVWKYDNNSVLTTFTPNQNDCIVAKIVGQAQIDSLQLYAQKNIIAGSEADTFRTNISDIISDNKLSPTEKQDIKKEWDVIVAEEPTILAQAVTYGITTEKDNYVTSYNALNTYITPLLSSLTTTSDITGTTFRNNFKDYYDKKTILLKKISETAKTLADNAQTSANTANNLLSDIANDNKFTPLEKHATKQEWDSIVAEKDNFDGQATTYGITAEKTNYDSAYDTLNTYITPLLSNLNTTSDIVGTTFRSNFSNYYDKKAILQQAISTSAKSLADTAQGDLDSYKLGNVVNVIDNRTDTLFHFDDNLCSTSGLNPNGGYVATLRPTEGKYGGCVAIEEGTVNLFSNPKMETVTGWSGSHSSTLSIQSTSPSGNFPSGVNACIKNTIGTSQTYGFTTQTLTLTASTTYTISAWVYIPSTNTGTFSLSVYYDNSGWQFLASSNVTERDKWVYKSLTFTSNGTYTSHILAIGGSNTVAGNVSYACRGQLEQKPFSTSFVEGTRAIGSLQYSSLNLSDFTTIFYIKNALWGSSRDKCWIGFGKSGLSQYINIFNGYGNDFFIGDEVNRTNSNLVGVTYAQGDELFFAITKGGTTVRVQVFKGGTKVIDVNRTDAKYNYAIDVVSVGRGIGLEGGVTCNSLVDELYITQRVLSDSEITAIYNLNKPFYDPNPRMYVPKPSTVTMTLL